MGNWPTRRVVFHADGTKSVTIGEKPSTRLTIIEGEVVSCKRSGETLNFGDGPVRVADAVEKAKLLRSKGLMPAPTGKMERPKLDVSKLPSFKEFFHQQHGVPLSESSGLIHGVKEG